MAALALAVIMGWYLVGAANEPVQGAASGGVPDTIDSRLIQQTVYRSYVIERQAVLTADTSTFGTVFANDARGGELSTAQIGRLQEATNQPSKTDFGYLDWQLDFFALRLAPQPVQPASESDEAVLTARPTAPGVLALDTGPIRLHFISIDIDGDEAVASFDDGARLCQMVLVKRDGTWLIAGRKVLRAWP